MKSKKIFILLPDGVGLRNFAYTDFNKIGNEKGFDITYWNATPFDLTDLGFQQIKIKNSKTHPVTDILKRALIQLELNQNIRKSGDSIYNFYRFPFSRKNYKDFFKFFYFKKLIFLNNSQNGIKNLRKKINSYERLTKLYKDSLKTLTEEKPNFIFCTNQRFTNTVAPILAAHDLGIPTATFIFSWDNLPKGTKIIETDYYFVWSQHMKDELLYYYPEVNEKQIFITGTPQFEPHFNKELLESKSSFFKKYNLDENKKYICFSGDDITTSPNDHQYLDDVANAVRKLNSKGHDLVIIFRRCPVDFSNRYNSTLENYKDIIVPINPLWKNIGEQWNTILPTKDDISLLVNTINNSELVINLGSSMVFDSVALNKPCAYVNYEVKNSNAKNWSIENIYKFVHFRSMPNKNCVFWLNKHEEIADIIEKTILQNDEKIIDNAQKWFEKINLSPFDKASERIWNAIENIISK